MNNNFQLIFVIGMQKSGTSLLNRMLMQQDFITNPFLPEGAKFWGDLPPFTPKEKPCGELFQSHSGINGHYLDAKDFRVSDQILLRQRVADAKVKTPILMNKNPYNSVRVPWLKSIFPKCKIYAVFRQPTPNIYSLLKKYHDHTGQGAAPDSGWWGIKPKSWMEMQHANKTLQCISQWNAVNKSILNSSHDIDYFFDYQSICESPNKIINLIKESNHVTMESNKLPLCKNFDNEFKEGSRLLSKNKELRKTSTFNLQNLKEEKEFGPLTEAQCQLIENNTIKIWQKLKSIKTQLTLD